MSNRLRRLTYAAALGLGLTLVMPAAAQQPATAAGIPTGQAPTKKDPLSFSAFNVDMPTGVSSVTEIAIERWTCSRAPREDLKTF